MATLTDDQRAFLHDNAYPGIVTTLREDGSPHTTIVWVDEEDGNVVFNTARGRAKDINLTKDPRVSVLMVDPSNAYKWVAVNGRGELSEEGADAHIDHMAKKYLDKDEYPFRNPEETRVIVRIKPDKIDAAGF